MSNESPRRGMPISISGVALVIILLGLGFFVFVNKPADEEASDPFRVETPVLPAS